MSAQWKGSVNPSFRIRSMNIEAPNWMVVVAWFGLEMNVAGFFINAVAGSVLWTIIGLLGAVWLGYWLWSYYQTRKA